MNLRTIPRAAVGGYLKALRWPIDTSLRLMGRGQAAEIAVDRAEATARGVAGQAMGDPELQRDAARRSTAADERERAVRLRAEAQQRSERADERLAERESQAERQRREAAERADAKRKKADQQRQAEKRRATQAEKRRREASEKAEAQQREAAEERAKRARLEQLDEEAGALAKQEQALTASDEAQRLGDAAARTKAARKAT